MPRDNRDRVAEAEILLGQEPATAEEREAAEEDARNPVIAGDAASLHPHELPPQVRPRPALFTYEELIGRGVDDATAIMIVKTLLQKNGGLVEYDEDAERERLHKIRLQQHEIAIIDGGNPVQSQLSLMEQYFAGAIERGSPNDPKHLRGYCRRYPYLSPEDAVVGINGYIFRIPRHKRVNLPEEAIDILEKSAQAKDRFDVLSAAYQAKEREPIYMRPEMSVQAFVGEQAANFPVQQGARRDGEGLPAINTSDSLWPRR
jgi:hypothetical protein